MTASVPKRVFTLESLDSAGGSIYVIYGPHKVEKVGGLYPIEVSQVGCILDRAMVS